MKKVFISFLIMTLTLTNISFVNISSVQAATTDSSTEGTDTTDNTDDSTIKVSLETIRDIMIENNLDIKVLNNNQKIAKEQYENAKDALSDAKSDVDNFQLVVDEETGATNASELTALKAARDKAESAVTTAKDNLKSARSKYDQGVEDKVYAAQGQYITYLSNLANEKLAEDTAKSKEKEAQISKFKYENGFISKNDYISSNQDNTDSTNELKKSKTDISLEKINLCNTLGLSTKENIKFETDITEDFKVILKINYKNDLNQMLDNNSDIKLKNDEIDNLDDTEDDYDDSDIYDYNVDNAKYELKQLKNTTEASFKEQYNTLMNSYNSIKSSYDKIIQEQNIYNTTQIKYDYGFVSKNEVDTAKLTFDKDNAAFSTNRNKLYIDYLRYIQMKEGY